MLCLHTSVARLLFSSVVSLGLVGGGLSLSWAVQAGAVELEPPASAFDTNDNPQATTQTQPAWNQNLPVAERFVRAFTERLTTDPAGYLDRNTGLVWEQSPGDTNGDFDITIDDKVSWNKARRHCLDQTTGGVRGWRMPSVVELLSLVDPMNPGGPPALPAGHPFFGVQSFNYWSATTDVANSTMAWSVSFISGAVNTGEKPAAVFVWCVRGGMNADAY